MEKVRIGIFGLNRGYNNVDSILLNGGEIVAVYDKSQALMARAQKKLGSVILCKSYEELLEQELDAVYLCNYFMAHAPYAIRALEKGISVISECMANGTMAEGAALVRAAEKSRGIYMLAENYPYMLFNREMQRVYREGTLGKLMFAEGEYNHPTDPQDTEFISLHHDGEKHWRNYIPATYYLTHSLGPLMTATGAAPVRVSAFPIYAPREESSSSASHVCDGTAIITTLNDDRSVYRLTGCARFGGHENTYRLACRKGQIENVRGTDRIHLIYSPWETPEGMEEINDYLPQETAGDGEKAALTGHGGGDYYMFREFFDCLRTGRRPPLDVYMATRMASVAILAHRSLLEGGMPYDVPDFSREEDRRKFENDRLTPFWDEEGNAPTLPCCSDAGYAPKPEMVERFRKLMETRDAHW